MDDPDTPLQKWEPGSRVQVGHPHPAKRFVALNESGTQRIGEDHARAKLTDAEVEAIRDEYEAYPVGDRAAGMVRGLVLGVVRRPATDTASGILSQLRVRAHEANPGVFPQPHACAHQVATVIFRPLRAPAREQTIKP